MKPWVLGVISLLLLTGCASSPSVEDQTKLLEYENCLTFEREVWVAESRDYSGEVVRFIINSADKEGKVMSDFNLETCAKYRP